MTTFNSLVGLQSLLRIQQEGLARAQAMIAEAKGLEIYYLKSGVMGTALETNIQAILDDVSTLLTQIQSELGSIDTTYAIFAKPYPTSVYTSAAIAVVVAVTKSTITANGGTPFAEFLVGDIVSVAKCLDSDSNGTYTIDTITSTVMTFTTNMTGADEPTDTAVEIRLVTR